MHPVQRVAARFLWFPAIGALVGAVLSLRALLPLGFLFAADSRSNAPSLVLLLVYPIAGATGGFLVALAFPLVRWVGGAFVVGVLAVFPLYVGVGLAVDHRLDGKGLEAAAAAAVFVGGIVGARAWLDENRRPRRLVHVWLFAVACSIVAWVVGLHWAGQWPAVVAVFLFLIPMALAVMVTVSDLGSEGRGSGHRAA